MDFKAYQHVERLGTSEVENILDTDCVEIMSKADGSNFTCYLNNDGELECGSRKRVLSLHNDNAGAYKYVMEHRTGYEAYLMHHPTHRIYGEWLVKHTVTGYEDSAWRKIYIFDVYDEAENRYLRFDEYVEEISNLGLDYIPPIAILDHPTLEEVQSYVSKCTFVMQDEQAGEGIVIHAPNYKNKYGHQIWAKIVRNEFKQVKKHPTKHNDSAELESDIIDKFCTEEFIKKEYAKIIAQEGKWESKMIPRLLSTIWHEFVKEESYNFVKKYKCPTINFKQLQGLCTEKIKTTLPTLF